MSATDLLPWGNQILANQAFSALLGVTLTRLEHGEVELEIPVTEKLMQQQGIVHGGVISYAADNALTFALGTVFGAAIVTAEFKINYLRPVTRGKIVARGHVVHAARAQGVSRCEIYQVDADGAEKLCAVAQGTINRISEERLNPSS